MEVDVTAILEPNETVVWQGIYNRKVLFVNSALILVSAVIAGLFITTTNGMFGLGIWAAGILGAILNYFLNWVKVFVVTKKRVLIKSGIIGTDFKSIYLNEIKNVSVDVDIIGKIFSVGTVKIDTGKTETYSAGKNRGTSTRTMYDKISYVDAPYDVYKYLQTSVTGRQESLYSGKG